MAYERVAAKIAGTSLWMEERRVRVASAFSLAEAAYRVAGFDRTAYIKKNKRGKWCVKSEKNPDWNGGCYGSKAKAEARLKQVEAIKHMKKGAAALLDPPATAAITFKSAPEYKSVEDFVQFKIDDEEDTFDHEDLAALNYRLNKSVGEVRKELESYGLSLKQRVPEKKPRGVMDNPNDRWYGPGSDATHGGSGSGTKWIPSAF